MKDDDKKKPPIATVSRIPYGPFGPIDPQYVEQRKEAERHVAKSACAHYVEQLSGSILIASIKANKPMTPAECVAKANEMADALGMGVAKCDKQ